MNAADHNTAGPNDLLACPLTQPSRSKAWWGPRTLQRYGPGLLSLIICFLARWSLDPVLHNNLPFCFFIIPVIVAGRFGGLRPSLMATGLGLFAGSWCFLQPHYKITTPDAAGWISIASYLITNVLICCYAQTERFAERGGQDRGDIRHEQRQDLDEPRTEYVCTQAVPSKGQQGFRAVLDAIPHQIWTARPDGSCDFASLQWEQYTGTHAEHALGQRWLEQVHPDDRDAAQAGWANAVTAGSDVDLEFRLRRLDGSYRWFKNRATPRRDATGEIIKWCGTRTEITDFVQRREALNRGHEELKRLLQQQTEEVERLKSKLQDENCYFREEISRTQSHCRLVGESPALAQVIRQTEKVAPTDSTVLLLGETGTGKDLLAEMVHQLSTRAHRPLVSVNCAAVPTALVESELFGREKGAFTGSLSRQIGRFELADGSTIFLDEIGELPAEVQGKLLRVLEARQIERLGNPRPLSVDVRIIAATNRDLQKAVGDGKFRQDLYYRLNVFPIRVPPLRERREDISLLVWAFVDEFAKRLNKNIQSIEKESLEILQRYSWPGNVRELRNCIERAMIVATGSRLRIQLPEPPPLSTTACSCRLAEVEREHIVRVLEKSGWRIRGANGAAHQLGLKATTLEARMAKLNIHRPTLTTEMICSRRQAQPEVPLQS